MEKGSHRNTHVRESDSDLEAMYCSEGKFWCHSGFKKSLHLNFETFCKDIYCYLRRNCREIFQ